MNSINVTLLSTTSGSYSIDERLCAAAVLFVYAFVGLLFYAIVLYVLIKNRSDFDNSYYIMVYYEAAADIGMLLLFILVVVPCAITNTYFYGERVTNFLANAETLFFDTMHFYLGPVALNRLFGIGSVISKRMSDSFLCQLFTGRKFVHAWMVFGWLWAATISLVLTYIARCPKLFFLDQLCFNYECADVSNSLFQLYTIYSPVYPAFTFIPYIILFFLLRWQRNNSTSVYTSLCEHVVKFRFCFNSLYLF
jgi:hypothetical protein